MIVLDTNVVFERSLSQADGQSAAIARSRGMAVATRNVRDFEDIW